MLSAQSKYEKTKDQSLVNEINQEATGVVAVLNSDNTITLSNDDGGQIAFSAAQGATDVGFTANADVCIPLSLLSVTTVSSVGCTFTVTF